MTKPTPPLPLFLRVQEVAQRWGVDSNYVMKFYFDGSANFLYGAFSNRLQPYDHREILAAAGEDPRTGENNIMEQMRFARDYLPKLEASMVWLSREEVLRLESQSETTAAPAAKVESAKSASQAKAGITKQKVINAFEGMHYNRDKWGKYLGDPPNWLEECRLAKGSKKASATWSPVLIAIALLDKHIAIARLDTVFVDLNDWADEWKEKSELFR